MLSPETQAILNKAFDSLESANVADENHAEADVQLQEATAHEADTKELSLEAHKQATSDAHDALAAIAKELNFELPV